ncbi:MAG TPA: adenylate/guanylate cyclase domain-containing protein [Actinomycetota bacterium]|nr:adenylate/guanylate cyclase domain-containing protein [Actinomycetota bacterium]
MNMRETILAALRRDPDLLPKITESLRGRIEEDQGRMSSVVQAAGALEPVLADVMDKRPSKLKKLGLRSAQVVASLASDDGRSNRRLAAIASGTTVGIVFIDVAGFTRLTEAEGDARAVALLRRLAGIVERKARSEQGEVVKHLGDGFLVAFPSAVRAINGALGIQDAIAREARRDPGFKIKVRASVHAGEPLVQGDDLLGHDVNLAARLLDHCKPGGVLVSEAAKELAEKRTKKIEFAGRRNVKIRGLSSKVAVYPVHGVARPDKIDPTPKAATARG